MKPKIIWKRYIQLSDLVKFSRRIKIDLDQKTKEDIYRKVINKIGSKRELSRKVGYGYSNIDNWIKGNQKCIGLDILLRLCGFIDISLDSLSNKITGIKTGKAGNFLQASFPIDIFKPEFINLLIHIFGDGTVSLGINKKVYYYNTNIDLVNKVKKTSEQIFPSGNKYVISKVYDKGDEIYCPNNRKILAKKAEWGLALPGIISYIISLHCHSLEEFKRMGIRDLIFQIPNKCIFDAVSALIEDEGCVRPDRLIICTTEYLTVANALKIKLQKVGIKSEINRQKKEIYDLVISGLKSLKAICNSIDNSNQKRKKIIDLIKIVKKTRADYYEVDSEIRKVLKTNKTKKYTATEIAWKIKRRRYVVNSALNRLNKNNLIKKANNQSQKGYFLYSLSNSEREITKIKR